jgi:hypothetical protein
MWTELAIFCGGFIEPIPLALLVVAALMVWLALAANDGRLVIGLPKSVARTDWDAARRRRAELTATTSPQTADPAPPD